MSRKLKALFVVVTLSATFIILFQMCVISLDPRSCPMDIHRQYLRRYTNAFPISFVTARAPLWIHTNSTRFTNLTPTLNMATLLKLNRSTELLRSSVDTQLTVLKLNSSSMEPTTSRPSISTTYAHSVVTEEPLQSIATFPAELRMEDHKVVSPLPHVNNKRTGSIKSLQSADTQLDAVGNRVRPSLHPPPPASSKQVTFLNQPQTQRTSLEKLRAEKNSKRRQRSQRRRRNAALLRAPLPTGVSPAVNLSSIAYLPLPRIGTYLCQDRLCTEVLTPVDLFYLNYCTDRQKHANTEIYRDMPLGKCHFIDGRNRTIVALVSFPGSGNTWVRGLLEQATGVCTGAIYCDVSLRASGFNGEGVKSGAVLVVKTHRPHPEWAESNTSTIIERGRPRFGAGILVIRNPFDALVAEWNREMSQEAIVHIGNGTSSHLNCVGREFFGENVEWNEFVTRRVHIWRDHFHNWLMNNMSKPILVVRFEDLKTDLIGQVKRMLDFLQFPYLEDELRSRLAEGFGKFRRVHDGDDFEHFTAKQRELIRTVVLETIGTLRHYGQTENLFKLTSYLHSDL